MKRPVGLILSAILLSLAALFLLLMTALTAFASIFAQRQLSIAAMPHFALYSMLAVSVFYAVLAAWAILTVIGILRLRRWGRYSILIIGGGLALLGVLAAAFSLLFSRTMLPALQAQQPTANPHIMSLVFLFVAAFYSLIAAVGIWWLIYFNLRSIHAIFSDPAILVLSSAGAGGDFSRTPTAIKIIGGFLLFSALCCLLCAFLPFPAFLFGFIVPPGATHILYVCFAAVAAFTGYGLLRLKEPARLLTIGFLIFGCCNILLAILPWYRAQFCLYMTQLMAATPTMPGQPQIFFDYTVTLIFISYGLCLIVYGLVFWLLHRHRASFRTPAPPSPTMLEA
jgi:hypothetical protein